MVEFARRVESAAGRRSGDGMTLSVIRTTKPTNSDGDAGFTLRYLIVSHAGQLSSLSESQAVSVRTSGPREQSYIDRRRMTYRGGKEDWEQQPEQKKLVAPLRR
jgi:hypothetical protein